MSDFTIYNKQSDKGARELADWKYMNEAHFPNKNSYKMGLSKEVG